MPNWGLTKFKIQNIEACYRQSIPGELIPTVLVNERMETLGEVARDTRSEEHICSLMALTVAPVIVTAVDHQCCTVFPGNDDREEEQSHPGPACCTSEFLGTWVKG